MARPALLLPRSRKPIIQVPLNLGHPMARGIAAFLCYPGNGTFYDAVTQRQGARNNNISLIATTEGEALHCNGSQGAVNFLSAIRNPLAAQNINVGIIARLRLTSKPSSTAVACQYGSIAGNTVARGPICFFDQNGYAYGGGMTSAGPQGQRVASLGDTTAQWVTICGSFTASGGIQGWVNGVRGAGSISGSNTQVATAGVLYVGRESDNYNSIFTGDIAWVAPFNRPLTDDDAWFWHHYPWEAFEPQRNVSFFSLPGGGSPTVSLAALSAARSFALAPASAATALRAQSHATSTARPAVSAALALAARGTAGATARAATAAVAHLAALAHAASSGRSVPVFTVALAARSGATSMARGALSLGATVALIARSIAQSTARAQPTAAAPLTARGTAQSQARARPAAAMALAARATATSTGRLLNTTGLVLLAALSHATSRATAVITAAAALSGASSAQAKARPRITAGAQLTVRSASTSAGRGGILGAVALAARSVAASAGMANLNTHLQLIAGRAQSLSGARGVMVQNAFLKVLSIATSAAKVALYAPPPVKPVGSPTPPSTPRANVPYLPPITPNVLPEAPFDKLIEQYGLSLLWLQSHQCPCVNSGEIIGTADPSCGTCKGLGVYWDNPVGPWMGLLTFMHMSPTPDEPGIMTNESFGLVQHGEPTLTIPYSAVSGQVWENASIYDAFVEQNALARLSAQLIVGGVQAVPYQQGLVIEPTGAVTVWDPVAKVVTPVVGYTVNGAVITLPPQYPIGTAYNVEFQANPVYIAYRKAGGMPHIRPFGAGAVNLPRRFRIQPLDIWTRARQGYPNGNSPQIQR